MEHCVITCVFLLAVFSRMDGVDGGWWAFTWFDFAVKGSLETCNEIHLEFVCVFDHLCVDCFWVLLAIRCLHVEQLEGHEPRT